MFASTQEVSPRREARPRLRGPACGGWCRPLAALLLLILPSLGVVAWPRLAASDRVLIPGADELWRTRLKGALGALRAGRTAAGLEVLEQATAEGSGVLYEIRDEDLLRVPLTVEIEDQVLVPEKRPESAGRRGGLGAGRLSIRRAPAPLTGGGARRFLPLDVVAQILLRELPEPLLEEYRRRHDAEAESLFERYRSSGESGFLSQLVRNYFFSSRGPQAAEWLADRYWEEGRWREAMQLWRRVVLDSARSEARFADAAPAAAAGEAAAAALVESRRRAERVSEKLAGALRLVGREPEARLVGETLGSAAQEKPPAEVPGVDEAALEARPARLDRTSLHPPALGQPSRWGGELTAAAPFGPSRFPLEFSFDSWLWWRQRANRHVRFAGFPFTLLIDGDSLFVSSPGWVHRLDSRPGHGSITQHYRKPGRGLSYPEDNETLHYTSTLWRKSLEPYSLLAGLPEEVLITDFIADVVEFDQYLGYEIRAEVPVRGLVAFDGASGDKLWQIFERALRDDALSGRAAPIQGSPLRKRLIKESGRSAGEKGLSYNSPVLVKEGLVVVGGWVQRGYITTALRAHDLRDGSLVWETLVSSSQLEQTMFGELAREPFPGAIAEAGGVVYYCTQQGAIVAAELETGRILWLATYDPIPIEATLGRQARKRLISWGPNAMLIVNHILIVTPRDSPYLYALDTGQGPSGAAAAGTVLWKLQNRGELRDLLGYLDGYLYFSAHGSTGVVRCDIRHLLEGSERLDAPPSEPGSRPAGDGPLEASRQGRFVLERPAPRLGLRGSIPPGALTTRGIVIVDGERLKLLSLDLETLDDISEPFRTVPDRSVPGRVQVAGDMVFITSHNLISAYATAPADQRGGE